MKSFFSLECKSLLNGLLEKDPYKRLWKNIDQIKKHSFFKSISWSDLNSKKTPAYLISFLFT